MTKHEDLTVVILMDRQRLIAVILTTRAPGFPAISRLDNAG
jgi:hypothetical protein